MDYIACKYDNFWWIGTINKIDGNYETQFMHPHDPSLSFSRPAQEDMCCVTKSIKLRFIYH